VSSRNLTAAVAQLSSLPWRGDRGADPGLGGWARLRPAAQAAPPRRCPGPSVAARRSPTTTSPS